MSTTTTKGYKKPSDGDRGTWFDDLEYNIDRVNDHDHDGSNSAQLAPKNVVKPTASIASGSWAAVVGQAGTYSQTVSLPSGYTTEQCDVRFYNASGHPLLLTIEKVTTTSYKVYINDNSLTLTAVYG